jgi:hypothetical protein
MAEGQDVAVRLVELLSEIDDLEHELHALGTSTFQENNDDWTRLVVGF